MVWCRHICVNKSKTIFLVSIYSKHTSSKNSRMNRETVYIAKNLSSIHFTKLIKIIWDTSNAILESNQASKPFHLFYIHSIHTKSFFIDMKYDMEQIETRQWFCISSWCKLSPRPNIFIFHGTLLDKDKGVGNFRCSNS